MSHISPLFEAFSLYQSCETGHIVAKQRDLREQPNCLYPSTFSVVLIPILR